MGDPSKAVGSGRFVDDYLTQGTVVYLIAFVLAIFLLTGCARATSRSLPTERPTGVQSVEFVVMNGIQEAILVFALWDTRRIAVLGDVSSFSTAQFDIRLQGEAVALSIESLGPGSRDPRLTPAPSTEFVPVYAGDRVEWIITDPGPTVEYRRTGPP